jgi:hypothetical protein
MPTDQDFWRRTRFHCGPESFWVFRVPNTLID